MTLKNNSVYLDLSSNTANVTFYAITLPSAAYSFGSGGLDHNNYYLNPTNPQLRTGGFTSATGQAATVEFASLTNWRSAFAIPQDANSIQADPLHLDIAGNLHIAAGSPNVNAGTAIAGVVGDIDGQTRGKTPDIGADEVAAPTAAGVSVGGRVTAAGGLGILNASVRIEGGGLAEPRLARTNGFGYYSLEGLAAGQTYVITVSSK
ncbi:MAG: carboxypeptidase-like regulatory domain-containing protein, partial [Pyrinomonadaceae bacterium]|nr:carboxypeptidase-like regulatory domain-containing protein [Pyrinomonadaceae bacterium]